MKATSARSRNPPSVVQITTVDLSLRFLVFSLMQYLRSRGYHLAGLCAPGTYVSEVEEVGIRVITVPMTRRITPIQDLRCLVQLVRVLRREKPDIVHTHTPKANLLGQWAARIAGVPIRVCTIHGFYFTPHTPLSRRLLFQPIETASTLFPQRVFLVNQEDMNTARALHICRPEKIRLLRGGLGIDVTHFDPGSLDPETVERKRRELGLPDDAIVVGFVGRLVREKGLPELFEAFREVAAEVPNLWLLVVGPYDLDKPDSLNPGSAREYGIADRSLFTGMRTDTVDLYGLMDIFVLPSHREGMPGVAMEAQSMGVPVITTDARGCREAVIPGETGLIIPVRDAAALAGAIRALACAPDMRIRMGRAGRRLALEQFDQRKIFAVVEREYVELLRRKKPGRGARAVSRTTGSFYRRYGKRLMDLAIAGPSLAILAPVMAATALGVRLTMGRPVLFRQRRPGLHGEIFTLLKFRTMREAQDADGHLLPDARRITRLGRFLRRTSLDELPELFNVLRGEMSLVGPRPLLTEYLPRYTANEMRRHDVRPGITGWAQVNGRNAVSWESRFEMDLWYVENTSLPLDLRILGRTLLQVVRGTGVSHEGHATMPEFRGTTRPTGEAT